MSLLPEATYRDQEAQFLAACEAHGVEPLVYQHLYQTPAWEAWPAPIRSALAHRGRRRHCCELRRWIYAGRKFGQRIHPYSLPVDAGKSFRRSCAAIGFSLRKSGGG